ncbi:MAG: hypothetical protein Q7W56_03555 [Candidatus Latescibacteria bacterium]|nr:hypothetical protein [Candidatus Latescibacterota bacterium]
MNLLLIVVVIALKFLLPVLFLRFPFAAGWANWLLDSVDGDLLIPAGLDEVLYQNLDKSADWVGYLFIFIWGWRQPIRREIAATFALRTVGQALFFVTQDEFMFFCFPNLLEPLFLVYATIARFRGWDRVQAIYRARLVWIWLGILVYKFQDEWFTHVANVDRTEFVKGLLR